MAEADAQASPAAAGTGEVAVIVVHGVGDNAPGSTVNYVVKSLREQQTTHQGGPVTHDELMQVDRQNEVYSFREPNTAWQAAVEQARLTSPPNPARPASHDFTVFGRKATLPDGRRAGFYELHWADLARSGTGWWDTIKGFARFVFEIPHVVDGFMRGTPGVLARLLRFLLLFATCFVRGPIAGYSVVMLAGGLIFISFGWIPEREEVMDLIGMRIDKGGGVIALLPPSWQATAYRWAEGAGALNNRTTMAVGLWALLIAATGIGMLLRRHMLAVYACLFVGGAATFYLLDIFVLRVPRYTHYAGLVYVDYLSVMLGGVALAGIYIFRTRRTKEVGFADLGLFMAFWSIFFIVHLSVLGDLARDWLFANNFLYGPPVKILTSVTTNSSFVHFQAFSLFYPYLAYLWAFWALLMAAAFVLAVVLYARYFYRWSLVHRGIGVALALACTQACVWLTALPALGIMHMDDVLCRGSLGFSTVKQPVSCQTKLERNREAVDIMLNINYGPIAPELDKMPKAFVDDFRKKLEARFKATLDIDMLKAMRELTLSFIWNGMILVVAGFVAVLVAIYRHLRSRSSGFAPGSRWLPRLIVNNLVLALLLSFGLVNIVLCIAWVVDLDFLPRNLQTYTGSSLRDLDVPAEVVQMAMVATTVFLAIGQLPQIATPLSGVLQIMQGLIDHHYRTSVSIAPRYRLAETHQPIRREHINRRLELMVRELVVERGVKDLIFLAHSQGTVIVYDYLRSKPSLPGIRTQVLTAGSPLGALYAYYFDEYDDMEDALPALAPRVANWTNLYRADDPIAGPILTAEQASRTNALDFQDIAMKPGGHMRYWQESIVCDTIRNLLAGRPPVPPANDRLLRGLSGPTPAA
jgi:hypothetical protein